MANKFQEILVQALAAPIEAVAQDQLFQMLEKLRIKNPDRHKTVALALYPVIDLELQTLAAETKNKIDDVVVRALKGAVEGSAAAGNIELPNGDED